MSISTAQLWDLIAESKLIAPDEIVRLRDEYAGSGNDPNSAERMAGWLVANKRLSDYQSKILLAGHAGPFVYGDYRIYDRIESGRMAGMFRATHIPSKHRVCLFFLSGQAVQEPATIARLAYQASQANRASIGHPHLMRCYHLADEGMFKFIALEDIQGRRVERRLATAGAMQPSEACRIARHAALGLARIHAMNQVHGDVRPANLWIETNGNTKLLMFPLARDPLALPPPYQEMAQGRGRLSAEADYLAPELVTGATPDARSDIYALGCTLYHMLANQAPFAGADLKHKLALHATEKPKPLDQLNPAVTPALAKLVNYMMAKDPDLRYQEANSIVEALLPHLSPSDAQTRPQPPTKNAAAYDAWLRTLKEPKPPQAAEPAPAPVAPQPQVSQPIVPVQAQVAPQAPLAPQMPAAPQPQVAMAAPVAPAPAAAPMQAIPVAPFPAAQMYAQPLRAVPVQAMPVHPGYAQPYGAPMYGQPAAPATTMSPASEQPVTVRTRRVKRQSRRTLIVVSLLVLALGGAAGWLWANPHLLSGGGKTPDTEDTQPTATPTTNDPTADVNPAADSEAMKAVATSLQSTRPQETIAAVAEPVWQSPTAGEPLKLKYLAPGAQLIVAIRPSDLLAQGESSRLLDERVTGVLTPWLKSNVPALVGTPLENIEQLLIGVLDRGMQAPEIALVARTREAVSRDASVAAWGNPAETVVGGVKVFQNDTTAYWLPPGEESKVIVVAPPAEMADIVASGGEATFLLPAMETLLRTSDAQRQLTVLVSPRYLSGNGRLMFTGVGSRLAEAISWLLAGDDPTSPPEAASFSLQLGELSFAELRLYDPATSPTVAATAESLRTRLRQFPKKVDVYIRGLASTPYSFEILSSSYDMLRAVVDNLRIGAGDKQIVARVYLPGSATHNLALVAHLAILENPGVLGAGGTSSTASAAQPQTAAEKLKKKISLAFPRNTLEVSMQMLSEELSLPITILGGDLQLEGITKNQSFGLDERDKPADEILQKIMKQANPDGKLVYVIKPGQSGGEELFITTRAAVAKRGDKLPPELELPK